MMISNMGGGHLFVVLVGTVILASQTSGNSRVDSVNMLPSGRQADKGYLSSCLGMQNDTFLFEWTPRVLRIEETVDFTMHFQASEQYFHGNVCLIIKLEDTPDPIYYGCRDQNCEQFIKFAKSYLPDLTCPIPKGYTLKRTYPLYIKPTTPVPAGKFYIKAEAWNENGVKLLCVEGTFEASN